MMTESDKLVSYIFLCGFLSGTAFMYTGVMMFVSGVATGIVCSRAGWVTVLYEKFADVKLSGWSKAYVEKFMPT